MLICDYYYVIHFMNKILFLFIITLSFVSATPHVQAVNTSELQSQIDKLQTLLKELQKIQNTSNVVTTNNSNLSITTFDDGKEGKPKITITAPKSKKNKFNKNLTDDPIIIQWVAANVAQNTNLTIDLSNVKIEGPVGGGSAQFVLPSGDSKGIYKWDIHGEGRASAGTYRVQLGLEECSARGCSVNAHFPGQEEDVTLYAQSRSVGVTVTGKTTTAPLTNRATISTIDDLDTPNPTITGVAQPGVTSVGFSIGQGDLIYGSGPINVQNNRWSHTIAEDLRSGKYTISLYVNNSKAEEKKFTVK
jgi:hypothetical protein